MKLRLILPAGSLVYILAALLSGASPASPGTYVPFLLSCLSFLPAPFAPTRARESILPWGNRFFPQLLCGFALAIALFHGFNWYGPGGRFHPVVHDEFAYLFQAKTFAAGRLFYPSPPEPLFFDAMHILTEPVYASKYPPGHALYLAPWTAVGAPWAGSLLLTFVSLLLMGALARRYVGSWGALLLVVLFGISPMEMKVAPTYLSQITLLAGAAAYLYLLQRTGGRGKTAAAGTAGALLGFLFFTRPLNALVLAGASIPLLPSFLGTARGMSAPRRSILFFAALAAACAAGTMYNRAITGSFTRMPWQEYAARYTPEDRLGFDHGEPPQEREIGPGKRMWLEQVLYPNRRLYTPSFAAATLFRFRIPYTTKETAPYAFFILLAPLFLPGRHRRAALWTVFYALLLHGAYLFYWFPWANYYHEISPLLLFLPLLGAAALVRAAARAGREGVVLAVAALILLALAGNARQIPRQIDFLRTKPLYHLRFDRLVEENVPKNALVFVHYFKSHNSELDLINNEPDLAAADRVFVHDFGGGRNRAFHDRYFPGRKPYLYLEGAKKIIPGYERPPARAGG